LVPLDGGVRQAISVPPVDEEGSVDSISVYLK
jgi:hypothetical protein